MANTANRIIQNTFWLYGKMAITLFVSLYSTRLILSALGTSDFGIYNIVGGAIAMLGFLNGALAGATQRFMNYAEGEGNYEKKTIIFNVSFFLHLLISLIVAVVLVIAGIIFFNGVLNIPDGREFAAIIVYGCLILSTVLTVTTVPYDAVLNSHENMKYYSIVGVIESLLKLLVAFACVFTSKDKLITYGILMAAIPFFTLSVMRIYCHKHYKECKISYKRYFDQNTAKEIGSFAGWNFMFSASSMITMQGMSVLLNIFGGVVVNAAHGIANQLSAQLMMFSNNMLKALNPVLVKSNGAGENDRMLEAAATGNKMSFLVFSFFAVPFIIEAPFILSIWLENPPEWAVLFVRLVLIRQMISQTYVTLETCINATGRIKSFMITSSVIWLLPIIIGYIMYKFGAPIYTIYLLLIATALIRGINALYYTKTLCGLNVLNYLKRTFFPCALQAVIVLISIGSIINLFEESYYRLFITLFISFTIYPLLSYFATFNSKEKSLIVDVLTKLKNKVVKI